MRNSDDPSGLKLRVKVVMMISKVVGTMSGVGKRSRDDDLWNKYCMEKKSK